MEAPRQAIAFGDVFVDNATRADYSSGNTIDAFKVYGTVTTSVATKQIFNGDDVTRNGAANGVAWDCDGDAHYWLPKAEYNFAAIVDGEAVATSTLPATINHVVADGNNNKDLLYATATVTTDENATPNGVNTNGVVAFNFSHLLSKMIFNITNETNQLYKVKEISVTGVAEDGIYTVGGTWDKGSNDTTTLTFGTADVAGGATVTASESRQILPVEQALEVTITYDVMDGETVVGELTKSGTITKAFAKSTVYAVNVTLTGTSINFSLGTVNGWTGDEGGDVTVQ